METCHITTTVADDGTSEGLPFRAGGRVEVIVLGCDTLVKRV